MRKVNKSHIIKLYPTKHQIDLFNQSCGVTRFAYNWGLQKWKEMHERKERISGYTLLKELTKIKKEQFPWMLDVSKNCPQHGIFRLEKAFKNFFNKQAKYPKFKKKGVKDSFVAVENSITFKMCDKKIKLPRIGYVKMAENLRFKGHVNNVVVKRIADMWFAVINITTEVHPMKSENQTIIGVDFGLKYLAVTSNGKYFKNPKVAWL